MSETRFPHPEMPQEDFERLTKLAGLCRGDIVKMTTLAGSGHPGGSMSSLDMFLLVANYAKLDRKDARRADRDRLVVSHGHTSPGIYAALGRLGFFDHELAVTTFRAFGSPFEGHVERTVPGIEWSSGNLGQGLSAACGMALSARLRKVDSHAYCFMGDGEQNKGQISEARRFAVKYGLGNVTAFIDYNGLQLSGALDDIMPQNLVEEWKASGWHVAEVDGHDLKALYAAVKKALADEKTPTCIVAKTVMSKGIPFIEDDFNYHGKALTPDELDKALKELGVENDMEELRAKRDAAVEQARCCAVPEGPARLDVNPGTPREYGPDDKIDGRGAWGKALADIAEANPDLAVAVFDCDLLGSVKTGEFKKLRPDSFFQAGIQEHHTAVCAGACSVDAVLTWWADFGVFATDETYNQHRLSDINRSQLKVVATHCGLDVGEDGKTHQCIDYVGVFANLFGYKVLVPADGNQADRCVRFMATEPGNAFMAVGRSKLPVILDEAGYPAFGGEWKLDYGKATKLRAGGKAAAAVIVMGQPTGLAVQAADDLKAEGVEVDVWNVCTPLAVDPEAVKAAAATGAIVTVEDHHVRTGLAAQVSRVMAEEGLATASFRALGVGGYSCSGSAPLLYANAGIDAKGIAGAVKEGLAAKK